MRKFIILLVVLFTSSLSAQSVEFTQDDKQIISNLFQGDWIQSDSLIELYYSENPNQIKYNFLKAYNSFYTRYVGNNNRNSRDETIRQVQKYSWDAIKIGEEMEDNSENSFYLGGAYAMLARVNVMSQNLWDAYWNANKAENYFEYVIENDPKIADAYFNLGVFEYFPAAAITGFSSVLAWFGGMSGDREEGISKILNTAENGYIFKDEALYALAIVQGRENDLVKAHDIWKSLSDEYPENNIFLAQVNRTYVAKMVEEKGVNFLKNEFENLDSAYNITNPYILNTLGYALVNQERFDEALVVFDVNVKKYPDIANGYDSLAEYYMTVGQNEQAIKYYKIAFDKLKTDSTVNDQFRERLEEGIRNNLSELGSKLDV